MKVKKLSDGGDVAARRSSDWWLSFEPAGCDRASFVETGIEKRFLRVKKQKKKLIASTQFLLVIIAD